MNKWKKIDYCYCYYYYYYDRVEWRFYLWPERSGLTGKKPKTKMERPINWIVTAAKLSSVSLVQEIEDIVFTVLFLSRTIYSRGGA